MALLADVKKPRPAVPDVSWLAKRAAVSAGPTGTRAGYRIGRYLWGLLGEQPPRGRGHPRPYEPKSYVPTGSGVLGSVEFRLARLLGYGPLRFTIATLF